MSVTLRIFYCLVLCLNNFQNDYNLRQTNLNQWMTNYHLISQTFGLCAFRKDTNCTIVRFTGRQIVQSFAKSNHVYPYWENFYHVLKNIYSECGWFRRYFRQSSEYWTLCNKPDESLKSKKSHLTFLACCNCISTEKFPVMIIGNLQRFRTFERMSEKELGFDYWASR